MSDRDTLEAAVRREPGDVRLRQRLGDVYLRSGLRTEAVAELQHVAGRFAADGHPLKAMAICKAILSVDPGNQIAPAVIADLYAKGGAQQLPASMSGALEEGEPAPIDLDSLSVFRDALADASGTPRSPIPYQSRPQSFGNLPRSPLFSALDKPAFEAVLRRIELRVMRAGDNLVQEGEPGESMFVVVQGVVNVMREGRVQAVMTEGAFFGEMALLSNAPRLASVVAATDGVLFEIPRKQLEELLGQHPALAEVIDGFYRDRLLANVLRVSPIFRALTDAERARVSERFVRHSLPPQAILLEQGKQGAGLCLLLRGHCEAFHRVGQGEELPLPDLREGDIFGEISLLTGAPCTATVRAVTYCEVLELPRDDFRELVLPNPQVRALVEEVMVRRLARTADLLDLRNTILSDYIV